MKRQKKSSRKEKDIGISILNAIERSLEAVISQTQDVASCVLKQTLMIAQLPLNPQQIISKNMDVSKFLATVFAKPVYEHIIPYKSWLYVAEQMNHVQLYVRSPVKPIELVSYQTFDDLITKIKDAIVPKIKNDTYKIADRVREPVKKRVRLDEYYLDSANLH